MPLFKITFTDNSTYEGGDSILNSKWNPIPDKAILRLDYFLSKNTTLVLSHFEAYSHFIEATQNVHGPKGTDLKMKLHNIYIMGLRNGRVTSYRINLNGVAGTDKYIKGDITKREFEFGKEFKGRPVSNWKKGIK